MVIEPREMLLMSMTLAGPFHPEVSFAPPEQWTPTSSASLWSCAWPGTLDFARVALLMRACAVPST
eukprot:13562267-Alexandrium_andersonii.AAC.1